MIQVSVMLGMHEVLPGISIYSWRQESCSIFTFVGHDLLICRLTHITAIHFSRICVSYEVRE